MMEISIASRCCLDSHPQAILFSRISRTSGWENTHRISYNIAAQSSRLVYRGLASSYPIFDAVYPNRLFFHRAHSMATSLYESTSLQPEGDSDEDEDASENLKEKILEQPPTSEQLQIKEESLVNFKSELAVMELEVQALVKLAEEIAQSAIPEGSRKINGKYIQSHLVSRLEAMHEKLKEQIKDVDSVQSKAVPVFWVGMAESVQVMGSFDGWSQGEYLSPEYDGSYTKFSSTLMLRPGRYEIKFLVDGEWKLSQELPTVGEGLTKNNLLVVE
ncbi:hypothetical protein QN277_015900 [Acacia crassicarpa]|uniref:AMP-activated protein kinase glycogen-binding domain-containing protein n=1 Tax=Acacia crassicarpa TaxID=499986 RepID=A0AAE1K1P1_9FABA|nr:hypothetical protein QN277_015900 [Acacia crassicarpa]